MRVSTFDSTFSFIPVVTLISETRDVTSAGREGGKKVNLLAPRILMHPIYIGPTANQSLQVGVTTATLGGRELQGKEWSSPISNK